MWETLDLHALLENAVLTVYSIEPVVAKAQNLATGKGFDVPYFRIITAFFLCILTVIVAAVLLKASRAQNGRNDTKSNYFNEIVSIATQSFHGNRRLSSTTLSVLEAHRITASADLCRIKVDGETIVLVVSHSAIAVLTRNKCLSNEEDWHATQDLARS